MEQYRALLPSILALGFLIIPGSFTVAAESDSSTPNHYSCKGKKTSLTMISGDFANTNQFDLTLSKKHYTANSESITVETSMLGNLYTIGLSILPDVGRTTATLILPDIQLGQELSSLKLKTQLIVTQTLTPSIIKPFEGAFSSYRTIPVTCTASMVN